MYSGLEPLLLALSAESSGGASGVSLPTPPGPSGVGGMMQRKYGLLNAAPASPYNLEVATPNSTQAVLTWTDRATNEEAFIIYRDDLEGAGFVQIDAVVADVETYTMSGLTPGKAYHVLVAAYNAQAATLSNIVAVTMPGADPPTNLTATPVSDTEIDLAWTEPVPVEAYLIYKDESLTGSAWELVATPLAPLASYRVSGLTPNTPYQFILYAATAAGQSPGSEVAVATTTAAATSPPSAITDLAATPDADSVPLAWTAATGASAHRIERRVAARPLGTGNIHAGWPGGLAFSEPELAFADGSFRGPKLEILEPSATRVRLLFTNYEGTSDYLDAPAALTIGCTLEHADGTGNTVLTPLTFNGGSATAVLTPGAHVWSDPIPGPLAAGSYWPRTYVQVAGGAGIGLLATFGTSEGLGEGVEMHVDYRAAGTITPRDQWGAYGPVCMIGVSSAAERLPVFGIVGDSVVTGSGDVPEEDDGVAYELWRGGWVVRGLAGRVPTVHVSKGGEQAIRFARRATLENEGAGREYFGLCDHVIIDLGEADIVFLPRTAAQVEADQVLGWRRLRAQGPGFPQVWQSTLTPYSTSTDGFITTTNQTTHATNGVRIAVNAWLRDGAPIDSTSLAPVAVGTAVNVLRAGEAGHPLAGVLEVADRVETARDSGVWKAYHTADGLHPTTIGYAAIKGVLDDLSPFGFVE